MSGRDGAVVGHIADHVVISDVAGDLSVPDIDDLCRGVELHRPIGERGGPGLDRQRGGVAGSPVAVDAVGHGVAAHRRRRADPSDLTAEQRQSGGHDIEWIGPGAVGRGAGRGDPCGDSSRCGERDCRSGLRGHGWGCPQGSRRERYGLCGTGLDGRRGRSRNLRNADRNRFCRWRLRRCCGRSRNRGRRCVAFTFARFAACFGRPLRCPAGADPRIPG